MYYEKTKPAKETYTLNTHCLAVKGSVRVSKNTNKIIWACTKDEDYVNSLKKECDIPLIEDFEISTFDHEGTPERLMKVAALNTAMVLAGIIDYGDAERNNSETMKRLLLELAENIMLEYGKK